METDFGDCDKCGAPNPLIEFQAATKLCYFCDARGEHMHVTCKRCGYRRVAQKWKVIKGRGMDDE